LSSVQRSARDNLLLAGGAVLVGGFCADAISSLIAAIYLLGEELVDTEPQLSETLGLVSDLVAIAAVSLATAAMLVSGAPRQRRLEIAALVLGLSAAIGFAANSVDVAYAVSSDAGGQAVSSTLFEALSSLAGAAAGFLAMGAFKKVRRGGGRAARDGHLPYSAIAFAAAAAFSAVAAIIAVNYYGDLGATEGYTTGISIAAAGSLVQLAGFVVAAVAFFNSRSTSSSGEPQGPRGRDTLLGVAAAVLAAAFLITLIGGIVFSSALADNGFDDAIVTSRWIGLIFVACAVAAATCAAAGFSSARRAPTQPGSSA